MQIFFEDVGALKVQSVCLSANQQQHRRAEFGAHRPSPTRNCHSGPAGVDIVLLVSIIGTMPVIPVAP